MTNERMEAKILGRVIGTADGWDQVDDQAICLYDFQPNSATTLPNGTLTFDSVTGDLRVESPEDGEPLFVGDAVTVLAVVPRE